MQQPQGGAMSTPRPNYTQIPNALFDAMASMKEAELRVVMAVCRQTFGWHKRRDMISLSRLQEITGLSRQGVINGVTMARDHGWIKAHAAGQSFEYEIDVAEVVNQVDQLNEKLVNEVDQFARESSQPSRPELVNEVDRKAGKLVNEVDTQKKAEKETSKENKKKKRDERADDAPTPPPAPLYSDPRVAAYTERFKRNPSKTNAAIIRDRVAAGDLDLWREILRTWASRGWSANGIAGMCERYEAAVIARQAQAESPAANIPQAGRKQTPADITNATMQKLMAEWQEEGING
jgi:phage replication O-like protein O